MMGKEQRSTKKHSHKYVNFHWRQPWEKSLSDGNRLGGSKGTQMVDFEKDTRRWWFSPRSWLWNSMRDSIASSTEPIWIRAILRSFLLNKREKCVLNVSTFCPLLCVLLAICHVFSKTRHLLKEFEGLDCGSWAGKEPPEVILHHRRPECRGKNTG